MGAVAREDGSAAGNSRQRQPLVKKKGHPSSPAQPLGFRKARKGCWEENDALAEDNCSVNLPSEATCASSVNMREQGPYGGGKVMFHVCICSKSINHLLPPNTTLTSLKSYSGSTAK